MTAAAAPHKLIKSATGDWEVVIGMEVHAQVTSNSKLFSGASTAFGGEPNSHVSLVDAAMPGMLPVINEECVRQAVLTGLGLNAKITAAAASPSGSSGCTWNRTPASCCTISRRRCPMSTSTGAVSR